MTPTDKLYFPGEVNDYGSCGTLPKPVSTLMKESRARKANRLFLTSMKDLQQAIKEYNQSPSSATLSAVIEKANQAKTFQSGHLFAVTILELCKVKTDAATRGFANKNEIETAYSAFHKRAGEALCPKAIDKADALYNEVLKNEIEYHKKSLAQGPCSSCQRYES